MGTEFRTNVQHPDASVQTIILDQLSFDKIHLASLLSCLFFSNYASFRVLELLLTIPVSTGIQQLYFLLKHLTMLGDSFVNLSKDELNF